MRPRQARPNLAKRIIPYLQALSPLSWKFKWQSQAGVRSLDFLGTPSLTPLSTSGTCQLEKTERNARTDDFGWRFCFELGLHFWVWRKGITDNNSQNVGDIGARGSGTMLLTKRVRSSKTEVVAPRHGFEPRFTAPKAAVLPLDDRGRFRKATHRHFNTAIALLTALVEALE
jgi:hypothetical protein